MDLKHIIIIILLILLSLIISYNLKNGFNDIIEGIENDDETNVMIYKNSGAIDNLQKTTRDLQTDIKQVFKNESEITGIGRLIKDIMIKTKLAETNDEKQNIDIKNIQDKINKLQTITTRADNTSQDNKERLLSLAKQSKEKANNAQEESDKITYDYTDRKEK